MRKVTIKAAEAMRHGYNMTSGNTRVVSDGNIMKLHGNTIAIYDRVEGLLTLRDSGWRSATTKERLNGVLMSFGAHKFIAQRAGVWYVLTPGGLEPEELWQGNLTVEAQ
jgi:hypothetical protein